MLFCLVLLSKYPVIQSAQESKVVFSAFTVLCSPNIKFTRRSTSKFCIKPVQKHSPKSVQPLMRLPSTYSWMEDYFICEKGFSLEKTGQYHISTIMQIILLIAVVGMVHIRTTIWKQNCSSFISCSSNCLRQNLLPLAWCLITSSTFYSRHLEERSNHMHFPN